MPARTSFLSAKAPFHVGFCCSGFRGLMLARLIIDYATGEYEYYNINPAPVPTLADCQELVSEVQGFPGSTLHKVFYSADSA